MDDQLLLGLAHLSPSHLRWTNASPTTYTRPLGLVEMFFHKMATLHHGRTDIFFRLPLHTTKAGILDKVLGAWTKLNQLHPSLSFTVEEDAAPQFILDVGRLCGEPLNVLKQCSTSIIYLRDYKDDVVTWMRNNLWNGGRKYLGHNNLARLFVFHDSTSGKLDLVLAIAHCISDGTSVVGLMNEFLELLTSDELSRFDAVVGLPTLDNYKTFQPRVENVGNISYLNTTKEAILAAMPMPTEVGYPPLPTTLTPPTLPRLRWYWAIRRVVSQVRGEMLHRLTTVEFVGENSPAKQQAMEPEWGALTDWKHETLTIEQTNAVMEYSKACDVKIGSLLFAASSIAVSNLNHKYNIKMGDTCLIGFPFSLRPYLSPNRERMTPVAATSVAEISPMSVQLGFGGIQLPSTPCTTSSDTFKTRFAHRAQSAQSQFKRLLSSPTLLQDGYTMALSRAANFSQGNDGWKTVKDATKARGKGTAINASMIGQMDRVIKERYSSKDGAITLDSSRAAYIGVRCRTHELLLETFTLNGQLTISLGHDRVLWSDECVQEYLSEFRRILTCI